MGEFMGPLPMVLSLLRSCFPEDDVGASDFRQVLLGQKSASLNNKCYETSATSAQRVPEPDPLPGIYFDTRPDPIQF